MKLASFAYVPPSAWGCAKTFWENLHQFKTAWPLVLFSDAPWGPEVVPLKTSPEVLKHAIFDDGKVNPYAINNALWLTALRIAREKGITHMLYLEADCRVGCEHWDGKVFDEFFNIGRPLVAGGNLAVYNPANYSQEAARRWADLVSNNTRKNVPIPTYGWLPAATKAPSCVLVNGALGIYDVAWMQRFFDLNDTIEIARKNTAFDMILGQLVWDRFQEDSYEALGHLNSVFSGYGDILTSEEERLQWLREGRYSAVHQIKSSATP